MINVIHTAIPDVLIIEPKVFGDERGYFFESWNKRDFEAVAGPVDFVQDCESKSRYGVVRGLHFQKGVFVFPIQVFSIFVLVYGIPKISTANAFYVFIST